jgi:hypothetical protein
VTALCWLTLARHRLRGLSAARPTLFALAWCAPGRVSRLVADLGDDALERDWDAFESSDWPATPQAELPAWFPAWYLIQHPAAAPELMVAADAQQSAAGAAAQLLVRILDSEKDGNSRRLVRLRQQLRDLNADLFSLYMARRTVFHR